MPFQNPTDDRLIRAIADGGSERMAALKWLVQDETLNRAVRKKVTALGGRPTDADDLLDDALIELVTKASRGEINGGQDKVRGFLLEQIVRGRCRQLMEHISRDGDLKRRVLYKLKNLGCSMDEAEGYYNQGFVKLERQLREGNYRGGAIEGYFYTTCVNERLNDRRKKKPDLPDTDQLVIRDDRTEEQLISNEQQALLRKWLAALSEKCRDTLRLWNDGYSMKEIADKVGYKDHLQAATARMRCLQKLMQLTDYQLWRQTEIK